MTVLSAQSIRWLCSGDNIRYKPLISPFVERGIFKGKSYGLSACTYDCRIAQDIFLDRGIVVRASTMERFCFPDNICGSVLDKSTWARLGVSVFNTHFDPGFEGFATIELVNFGVMPTSIEEGSPICQFKFEWLDEPTELPYQGKYNNQESGPQAARYEQS